MEPDITQVIAQMIASPPGNRRCVSVKEAVDLALQTRPQRYGFSTEYAHRRYRALKRGGLEKPNDLNTELWQELAGKVDRHIQQHPGIDDYAAMEDVLASEQPSRYFLTPLYAEKLFYHRRRKARGRGK